MYVGLDVCITDKIKRRDLEMRRGCILCIAMPSVAVDGMIELAEPVRKLLCGEVEGIQIYFKHL